MTIKTRRDEKWSDGWLFVYMSVCDDVLPCSVLCIYEHRLRPLQPDHPSLTLPPLPVTSALFWGKGMCLCVCLFSDWAPPRHCNIVCKVKDTAVSNSAAAAANRPRRTFIWHVADRITVYLNETIYQWQRRGSNLVGQTIIWTGAVVGVWVYSDKGRG